MNPLEMKVPPPVVALLVAAAMWGLAKLGSPPHPLHVVRHVVAPALFAVALCLALAGIFSCRRAKTTINPHVPQATSSLVTWGVYRFSRNPMYASLLLILVGWALFLWSPWSLVGPVVFVLYIDRFQIVPEERVLAGAFGDEYAAYRAKVRKWL